MFSSAYIDHLPSCAGGEISITKKGPEEKHKRLLPRCHKSSHYGDKRLLCLLKREEGEREMLGRKKGFKRRVTILLGAAASHVPSD